MPGGAVLREHAARSTSSSGGVFRRRSESPFPVSVIRIFKPLTSRPCIVKNFPVFIV